MDTWYAVPTTLSARDWTPTLRHANLHCRWREYARGKKQPYEKAAPSGPTP